MWVAVGGGMEGWRDGGGGGRLMLGRFGKGKGIRGGGLRLGSVARKFAGAGLPSSRRSLWAGIVGSTLEGVSMLEMIVVSFFLTDLFRNRICHVLCFSFSFFVSSACVLSNSVCYLEALRELHREALVSIVVAPSNGAGRGGEGGYLHSSHRTQSLCNRISEDDVGHVGFGIGHHGLPQLTAIRSISGGAQD